jgi:isopentenyl phosphate kinase
LSAVHGAGAFRHFKNAIQRLGLENSWFQYREAAVERVAKEWLDENKIPYR